MGCSSCRGSKVTISGTKKPADNGVYTDRVTGKEYVLPSNVRVQKVIRR